jgi:hypothetical protein
VICILVGWTSGHLHVLDLERDGLGTGRGPTPTRWPAPSGSHMSLPSEGTCGVRTPSGDTQRARGVCCSTPAFSGEDPENSRVSMMRHPTDSATVKMAAGSERRVGDHQGYHGQQDQRGRET